ncbi:hypothetical protein B0I35DRAFT_33675 [Stachybotrys elegans]|uniref:Uncharacterized protein n=1 Tax=Stachybotrys elegans TaxID=80388 RepID=A0A8K0WYL3_9HYPO|nr:hypothetical protein B0I35DRAFT_33675 [Stachybotrys elegans]
MPPKETAVARWWWDGCCWLFVAWWTRSLAPAMGARTFALPDHRAASSIGSMPPRQKKNHGQECPSFYRLLPVNFWRKDGREGLDAEGSIGRGTITVSVISGQWRGKEGGRSWQ